MRKPSTTFRFFIFNLLIFAGLEAFSQTDSVAAPLDSSNISSKVDSVPVDTDEPIDQIIYYPAEDSTVYDIADQRVRMYGGAKVTYGSISLTADYIEYDFTQGTVYAHGLTDTSGTSVGKPVFSENGQEFTCDTIKYGFESKKGLIKTVRTDDGESYVHAKVSKKQENDHVHNLGGKYTTCSAENPHYHFHFKKMVVIPDDKIITGPAYMKIRKIPLPLGIPFGFFPNSSKQKQGIVIPSYGYSAQRGYYLIDGGYYVPINDYLDTKFTGDIYSRGSWGLKNITRYRKNYRFSGSTDISFNNTLNGQPELLNFSRTLGFFVRWSHTQDSKARPGTTFSGSVNAGSSNNFTNNYNSSQNDFVSNTFASNVSYGKRFKSSSLSISMRHSQNTQTETFDFTLPQLTFNKSRFFLPLSIFSANQVKAAKLDKKVGITYSGNFKNALNTTESELGLRNLSNLAKNDMVNGVQHSANMSSAFNLGYFKLSPRISLTQLWHFKKEQKEFDFDTQSVTTRDVQGFFATTNWNMGADLNTILYGTVTSKRGRVQAIRHVMTPTIGFSLAPEFNFNEAYLDTVNVMEYNPFVASAYRQSNTVKRSAITFSLQNSLEMKVRTNRDSVETVKKVKLIESFRISTSYNLAAEEYQLALVRANARTTLFKNVSLQWNGVLDPYDVDAEGTRINDFRWGNRKPFLRSTSNVFSLATNLSGGDKSKDNPPKSEFASTEEIEEIENNPGRYADFNIPWTLNLSYSFNLNRAYEPDDAGGRIDTTIISQHGVLFNGSINVLNDWKLTVNSGYDFKNKEITPTQLTLYWDLHCWEFRSTVVPFGTRKSYNLSIGVKASVLQDLKIQRRGSLDRDSELLF